MKLDTFFDVRHMIKVIIDAFPILEAPYDNQYYYPFEIIELYTKRDGKIVYVRFIDYHSGYAVVVNGDPEYKHTLILESQDNEAEDWDRKHQSKDLIMLEYACTIDGDWEFHETVGSSLAEEVIVIGCPSLPDIYEMFVGGGNMQETESAVDQGDTP